jgi:hypothetical protein
MGLLAGNNPTCPYKDQRITSVAHLHECHEWLAENDYRSMGVVCAALIAYEPAHRSSALLAYMDMVVSPDEDFPVEPGLERS